MPASYTYITTAATTVIGSADYRRVNLKGIFINKPLTGTLTIKSGSTTIGVIAASTPAGTYWNVRDGLLIQDLQIVNASTEDVVVATTNN